MGDASLKEHRAESSSSMGILEASLLFGLVAFKKNTPKHKWAAMMCIVTMLISAIIMMIPLIRVGRLNYRNHHHSNNVNVRAPYAILISGAGVACAMISMMFAWAGFVTKQHMSTDSREQEEDMANNNTDEKNVPVAGMSVLVVSDKMAKEAGPFRGEKGSGMANIEFEPETKPY